MSVEPVQPVQPLPPRRRSRWLRVLIIVGVPVLLCCGGCIWSSARIGAETVPVTRAAEAYLDAVAAGDEGAALARVCDSAEAEAYHQRLASRLRAEGIRSHEVIGTNVESRNFSLSATATAKLAGTNGTYSVQLPLRKHDGEWQICGD